MKNQVLHPDPEVAAKVYQNKSYAEQMVLDRNKYTLFTRSKLLIFLTSIFLVLISILIFFIETSHTKNYRMIV